MQRLILTIIAAFVMAIVFGPVVIPWLRRMKFGQTIYDLGPQSHKKKQGIPTMVYYPKPMHAQTAFAGLPPVSCPVSDRPCFFFSIRSYIRIGFLLFCWPFRQQIGKIFSNSIAGQPSTGGRLAWLYQIESFSGHRPGN